MKPLTKLQVIAWARDACYPMERCSHAESMLIGPHFVSHLEHFAALVFEAGKAAEREKNVAYLLSNEARHIASLDQIAAVIQTGEE